MEFARALDKAAKAAGLSDVEIAARMGVAQQTVRRWRAGHSEPLVSDFLKLLVVVPALKRELVDSRSAAVA